MTASSFPELLLPTGPEVRLSEDAGGYYCAHVFFLANQLACQAAARPGLVENGHGEPLVGFLHVPRDPACTFAAPVVPQVVRHAKTRVVVAAALRGYVEDALAADVSGPVRLLVTGFGPFRDVLSNPTGDFVSREENLRTCLALAFGPSLVLDGAAVKVLEGERAKLSRLKARAQVAGREVPLEVGFACLPVDDDALDPGRTDSLPGLLDRFRPHALLCLGVCRDSAFRVEVRPDTREIGRAHV